MMKESWEGQADLTQLEHLKKKTEGFYLNFDVDVKKLTKLVIAFEEMFVNVAGYAYEKPYAHCKKSGKEIEKIFGGREVWISWIWDEKSSAAQILLRDRGIPYNPLERPEPDLTKKAEDRQMGGLGIHMVKVLVDELAYVYEQGENRLTLIKGLNKEQADSRAKPSYQQKEEEKQ